MNSDKNEGYIKETTKEIEKNFYYDYGRYSRNKRYKISGLVKGCKNVKDIVYYHEIEDMEH